MKCHVRQSEYNWAKIPHSFSCWLVFRFSLLCLFYVLNSCGSLIWKERCAKISQWKDLTRRETTAETFPPFLKGNTKAHTGSGFNRFSSTSFLFSSLLSSPILYSDFRLNSLSLLFLFLPLSISYNTIAEAFVSFMGVRLARPQGTSDKMVRQKESHWCELRFLSLCLAISLDFRIPSRYSLTWQLTIVFLFVCCSRYENVLISVCSLSLCTVKLNCCWNAYSYLWGGDEWRPEAWIRRKKRAKREVIEKSSFAQQFHQLLSHAFLLSYYLICFPFWCSESTANGYLWLTVSVTMSTPQLLLHPWKQRPRKARRVTREDLHPVYGRAICVCVCDQE